MIGEENGEFRFTFFRGLSLYRFFGGHENAMAGVYLAVVCNQAFPNQCRHVAAWKGLHGVSYFFVEVRNPIPIRYYKCRYGLQACRFLCKWIVSIMPILVLNNEFDFLHDRDFEELVDRVIYDYP